MQCIYLDHGDSAGANKNRHMKHYFLFLTLLLSSLVGIAQTTIEPDAILENFFKVYQKEGSRAAVNNIYSFGDSSMQQSKDYVSDTLYHTAEFVGGKCLGSEQINKKVVTPSLIAYTYMVKFKYAPLRLTFIFYKPSDKWMIQHFSFDANLFNEVYKSTRLVGQ